MTSLKSLGLGGNGIEQWLEGNETRIDTVAALANDNEAYLEALNQTFQGDIDNIQAVIDELGITIGDTDYDGLDDLEELEEGTSVTKSDTDVDNLNDAFEIKLGTDPLDDDSDDDGYYDGIEVAAGTDPLDPASFPNAPPNTNDDENDGGDSGPENGGGIAGFVGVGALVSCVGIAAIGFGIFNKNRPKSAEAR